MQKEITPIFRGVVKDGKMFVTDKDAFNNWLLQLNDKKISIKVAKWRDIRTDAQNKFLWVYYKLISDELTGGDTPPEYYHEYFKRIFIDTMKISVMGRDIIIPGSTTELSKQEYSKYLLKIEKDTGVPIPIPHKVGYSDDIYSRKMSK